VIPTRLLADWRPFAPWPDEDQVEQDLILTRVLIALFSEPRLAALLAFRGGTAIHKTALPQPLRYSEDIDLVEQKAGPIKPILLLLQPILDTWLGTPSVETRRDAVRLVYRYDAEGSGARRRAKVEINTREHGAFDGWRTHRMACDTRWFRGEADLVSFSREELMATKLRALYQRKKGRDLFDLAEALIPGDLDVARVVSLFRQYLQRQGLAVSRREFEANLDRKITDPLFLGDVRPLLRPDHAFDPPIALELVKERLVSLLA
jgi:predicted nucleotidyltransferase component of viral defense system